MHRPEPGMEKVNMDDFEEQERTQYMPTSILYYAVYYTVIQETRV